MRQIEFEKNIDESPAILWITEPDGVCTYLNKQWYSYTGQTEQEALGFGWLNAIHPDDRERVESIYFDANAKQIPFFTEYRLRTATGDYRWAVDSGNPRYNDNGSFSGYAGAVFDVHDFKVATLELEHSKERYRLLFDHSPLPKWMLDIDTLKFIDVNETAIQLYGYSREEFLSLRMSDLYPLDEEERILEEMQMDYERDRTFVHLNYRHVKKDGSLIHVEVSTHDLELNGRRSRLAVVVDVTRRVEIEERQKELVLNLEAARDEAERLKEEAEKANRAKSNFLANVSHEIRTPLGVIQGFAQLLNDGSKHSPEEQKNWIATIGKNAHQLTSLIDELLDLSKIEAEKLEIENIDFSLSEVVEDVTSLLSFKAKNKGIKLRVVSEGAIPKLISADPKRLRQILINTIGNAIKFTQWGGVEVRLKVISGGKGIGPCQLQFSVKDTGVGISPDEQAKLFKPFSQADGSITRKFGGTGLGLYISRKLAQAMGGDLVLAESKTDGGSTFVFTVRCESKDGVEFIGTTELGAGVDARTQDHSLDGVSVLVVEDAIDNQVLITRFLTMAGAHVEVASNGLEGIQKALNGDHNVILMDLQMPEVDGYEATKKLRSEGFEKPIIAFTAHAMKEERDRCLESGFNDHVSKPVKRDRLIETISSLAKRKLNEARI